jgi:hypothetical protein
MRHLPGDQRRDILGELVLQRRIVGDQHLGDAGDLGGLLRGAADAGAGDQQVDVAELAAAVTTARVASFSAPPSCSARTSAVIRSLPFP